MSADNTGIAFDVCGYSSFFDCLVVALICDVLPGGYQPVVRGSPNIVFAIRVASINKARILVFILAAIFGLVSAALVIVQASFHSTVVKERFTAAVIYFATLITGMIAPKDAVG
jgi:hypothetical protein